MALQDLIQGWASRGFADFPGLAIEGSIPLKQELLNQLIAQVLSSAATPARPAAPGDVTAALLPLLKKVEVAATQGVVTLHIELRV